MARSARCSLVALILVAGFGVAAAPAETVKVEDQKAAAMANWKRLFAKGDPPHHETTHFLIYGTAPGKSLKDVGVALEKLHTLARKTLEMKKEPAWAGKLTVYLFAERAPFAALVRGVEKRLPEPDERGSFAVKGDFPHVAAGPGKEAFDLTVDQHAGEMIAQAMITKKAETQLPDWLLAGFGRATVFHAAPTKELTAEHRRASALAFKNKRTAQDIYGGNLKADEAPVLRASLVEYLAYSGRSARFVSFVTAHRPTKNQPNPTTDTALKAADISPDRLNQVWQNWVKSLR